MQLHLIHESTSCELINNGHFMLKHLTAMFMPKLMLA